MRFQEPGILLVDQCPPTCGNDVSVQSCNQGHHLAFKSPEVLPAVLCYNRSNAATGECFNACIGIDKRKLEALCQHFAHATFPSTAQTGQNDKAEACFEEATRISTLSETYLNYAQFLVSQQRAGEAREWAQKVLQKKPTMPSYLRRRERPWFRKANALLKRLPEK